MQIEFNPAELTLGDIEDLETYTGFTFDEIVELVPEPSKNGKAKQAKAPPMKVLVGLAWIMRRKANPEFTVEDARGLTFVEVAQETPAPNRAARRAKPKPRA